MYENHFLQKNDFFNLIQYLFHVNNYSLRSKYFLPSEIVIRNNKNLFLFLDFSINSGATFFFISSFFKNSQNNSQIVFILQNNLSKNLVSKITNNKMLFIKPVTDSSDFSLNIYPLFLNLENDFNVIAYSYILKLFFKKKLTLKKTFFLKTFFKFYF